jgi:EAL domain-containing protein (putative c-di-GMP-specific phosphodiesterase class I)
MLAFPLLLLGVAAALVLRGDRDGMDDLLVHAGVLPLLAVGWWWSVSRTGGSRPWSVAALVPAPAMVLYCDVDSPAGGPRRRDRRAVSAARALVEARIRAAVQPRDDVLRLRSGGFAVPLDGADLAEATRLAGLVQHALAQPVLVGGRPVAHLTGVGIAEASAGESLDERARDRQARRAELRRAVADAELLLHDQPTVDLTTATITGFEALVRWDHPARGLLPPAEFVPLAEQCDVILGLGDWVLAEACRAGAELQSDGFRPTMAVNIAARQLAAPAFVERVTAALADAGLPADRLILEITETVVLDDMTAVVARLSALRALGVRIAIDDFGSGYNSLSYLSQLPVDMLKVDKSFVDQVCADPHGAAVAEGIIAMSRTMKLRTVAEGVELPEQASWLRRAACAQGQGFLWSRPVDLDAARSLLHGGPLPVPA